MGNRCALAGGAAWNPRGDRGAALATAQRRTSDAGAAAPMPVEFGGEDFQCERTCGVSIIYRVDWCQLVRCGCDWCGDVCVGAFAACRTLETVYVPIGMGSGVCGTIAARDALGLATKVLVVSSWRSRMPCHWLPERWSEQETLTEIADGGLLAAGRYGVKIMMALMDRVMMVDDDEVKDVRRGSSASLTRTTWRRSRRGRAGCVVDIPCDRWQVSPPWRRC